MQRSIITAFLLTLAATGPVVAQPIPSGGAVRSYYPPQAMVAQPPYPQQQYAPAQYAQPQYAQPRYAQPQYAEPERPNMGGGFIEFIFSGGQTRYSRPAIQSQP